MIGPSVTVATRGEGELIDGLAGGSRTHHTRSFAFHDAGRPTRLADVTECQTQRGSNRGNRFSAHTASRENFLAWPRHHSLCGPDGK